MTRARPPGPDEPVPLTSSIWQPEQRRMTSGDGADSLAALGDAKLQSVISQRNEAGLEEAVRRHESVMLRSARRLLLDESMAEEVVQEVFLRLWNNPEKFDPARGSLRAFLLAQAHSRGVDVIRSETARRDRERRARDDTTGTVPSAPDERAADVLTALSVRDALARLPTGEREAIEVAYFGCCSYVEVAKRLSVPEGTVKSRIRTGLLRLRDELSARGIRPEDLS